MLARMLVAICGSLVLVPLAWSQAEVPPGLLAPPVPPEELIRHSIPPPQGCWDDCGCQLYTSLDYLLWGIKPAPVPVPLVATTSVPGALRDVRILAGQQDIDLPAFHGFRGRLGLYGSACCEIGVEMGGFYLPEQSRGFSFGPPGGPTALILPFLDTTRRPFEETGVLIAGPVGNEVVRGGVTLTTSAEVWSAEIGPVLPLTHGDGLQFDVLVAFRLLGLREELALQAASLPETGAFATLDRYRTSNYFYGVHAGGRLSWEHGPIVLDVTGKLALGAVGQNIRVDGSTLRPASIVTEQGGPGEVPGGVYSFAQQGETRHTRFAVVPELGIDLSWQLTDLVTVRAGYTFLYWSSVARPGEQVVRAFSGRELPVFGGDFEDVREPDRLRRHTDFWAHGLSLGVDLHY